MRNLLFIFILFITYKSNAQCELNLKELTMSIFYTQTAFNDYVLEKGFSLNTQSNISECIDELANKNFVYKTFLNDNKTIKMTYVTFSVLSYIKMKKEILETNFKLINETNTETTKSVTYNLQNLDLIISNKSVNGRNYYEFLFIYNK